MTGWDHERVHIVQDATSGLRAVIAIHSTVLGPALGGLRLRAYSGGVPEALEDALRLSRAMTLKAALAGLDLGGGKAVMLDDGESANRSRRLVRLAGEIEALGGAYVTAEDVGTSPADMDLLAEHTSFVVGTTRREGVGGDPSPDTARTVLGAIRAALAARDGSEELADRAIGIIGLGKVGGRLARALTDAGARVVGFDPSPAAAAGAGVELAPSASAVLDAELDVLAPCALGGLIDEATARRLRCHVVCGAANNPLTAGEVAATLAARDVLYVPDFLANCGGLIHVDAERRGETDSGAVDAQLEDAQLRTRLVLDEARETGRSPLAIAEEHACARIAGARGYGLGRAELSARS